MSDKYKDACVEYAAAHAEIKGWTVTIGQALEGCQGAQQSAWMKANPEKSIWDAPTFDNHLKAAYESSRDPDGNYFLNHDDDVEGYLGEVCPHCLAAHLAIQKRKAERKRFGIAKRRIAVLGRAAK